MPNQNPTIEELEEELEGEEEEFEEEGEEEELEEEAPREHAVNLQWPASGGG